MKKCNTCGKESGDFYGKVCTSCGGTLEKEIESVMPKKAIKEVKKRPFVYLTLVSLLVVIAIGLSIGLAAANKSTKQERDSVATLNIDLQKKENQLNALQESLSQTEEGRKQLEAANNQVQAKNAALDTRATSAEQVASKAKSDLAKTQSELSARQAELASKQAELASVNAQLAKAQRGVAKFNQTENLFNQFYESDNKLMGYIINAMDAINKGDAAATQKYIDLMDAEIKTNVSIYGQIKGIFDSIKSGNY